MRSRSGAVFALTGLFILILLSFLHSEKRSQPPAAAAADPPYNSWPTYKHNRGRTGYNPNELVLGADLTLYDSKAISDPDAQLFTHILAAGNTLLVQNQYAIWALDQETLALKWRFEDCLAAESFCMLTGFASAGSFRVYLVKQDLLAFQSELIALDIDSGEVDWSRVIENDLSPQILSSGGNIWLLWQDNGYNLVQLSSTGSELSIPDNYPFEGAFATGSPVSSGSRLFMAHGNEIIAYSILSYAEDWRVTDSDQSGVLNYDLVALQDTLLVAQGERVFALDPADSGQEIWAKDAETCEDGYQPVPNILVSDGTYVTVNGLCNKDLVTYLVSDGTEVWRKSIGPFNPSSAVAAANGTLFVTAQPAPTEAYLYLYSLADGTLLQQVPLNIDDLTNTLAISDQFLYSASALSDNGIRIYEREPADLRAEISKQPDPVCNASVGGTLNYEFKVINNGNGQADDITAVLDLPSGPRNLTLTSGGCFVSGVDLLCNLGSLAKDEEIVITAVVTPTESTRAVIAIEVDSNPRDPDRSNNRAESAISIVENTGTDLFPAGLEVTQGIQNLNNDIPLTENKSTVARAYIRTDGEAVSGVSAWLHGRDSLSGVELPGSPILPVPSAECVNPDGTFPDRSSLGNSVLFELPDTWLSGEIDLELEVNPTGAISETVPANNSLTVPVGFVPVDPICIRTYRVRTLSGPQDGGIDFFLSPSSSFLLEDPAGILTRTLSLLPTAEMIVVPESTVLEEWEFSEYGPYEFNAEDTDEYKVLTTLLWHSTMSDDPAECAAAGARTHYLGMVHENTSGSEGNFNGIAKIDGDRLVVRMVTSNDIVSNNPYAGRTLAHELGHNYDRRHVVNSTDCGDTQPGEDPFYYFGLYTSRDENYPYDTCMLDDAPLDDPATYFGFDILTKRVIDPSAVGDLMSYADTRWTSDYTWKAFQDQLPAAPVRPTSAVHSPDGASDVLILHGQAISDSVHLSDMMRLPTELVPTEKLTELLSDGGAGPYTLELLDVSDTPLITKTLPMGVTAGHSSSGLWFSTAISYNPAAASIRILFDGTPVFTQAVSPNPPAVTILAPSSGEIFTDTLTISWAGSDQDPETELAYTVQYSNDSGVSWRVLAAQIQTTTLTIDSSLLPGSLEQGQIRVIASDGINTSSDTSEMFTISPKDPLVYIQTPKDGDWYSLGETVRFIGVGYDPEDGTIPAQALQWDLSGPGIPGSWTGKDITLNDLPIGNYTLTLSTTDTDGQTAEQTITFEVRAVLNTFLPLLVR